MNDELRGNRPADFDGTAYAEKLWEIFDAVVEEIRGRITVLADIPFEPGPYTDGWRGAVKDALAILDEVGVAARSAQSDSAGLTEERT